VAALSLGIVKGPAWGWGDTKTITALIAGALLLIAVVYRSGTHRAPVFELSLFKVRSFSVAVSGTFLFSLAFYALLLCNILFLTQVWHYSILKAGFAVTPGPLMAAVSAALSGRIADRFGSGAVAFPGGVLFAAGTLYIALVVSGEPNYLEYLPGMMLTGLGVGASFAGFGSAAVAELPPLRYATGSAINATCRQIGAVLGIAVLIAILGDHPALSDFQAGWTLMVVTGAVSALAGFSLGRVRATVPAWTSKSAPSTTPSPERAPSAARS
jgi:MFS family permease